MTILTKFITFFWALYIFSGLVSNDRYLFATVNAEYNIIIFVLFLMIGSISSNSMIDIRKNKRYFVLSEVGKKIIICFIYINLATLMLILFRILFYRFTAGHNLLRVDIFSPFESNKVLAAIYVLILFIKSISSVFVNFIFLKSLLQRDLKWLIITSILIFLEAVI